MSLFNVFSISGSAMSAQSVRLNTTASNLANADAISGSEDQVYRARYPIFEAELAHSINSQNSMSGVKVSQIVESETPLKKEYLPGHALADKDGFVYKPNINVMEQMADMISASRSYQLNVQLTEAAKSMLQQTIKLGQ